MIVETVYNGRDNTIDLLLKDENGIADLSSVTRMDLVASGAWTVSNSDPSSFPIQWVGTGQQGKVMLRLGDESLPVGTYTASLVVFDPSNPDGIVWGKIGLIIE